MKWQNITLKFSSYGPPVPVNPQIAPYPNGNLTILVGNTVVLSNYPIAWANLSSFYIYGLKGSSFTAATVYIMIYRAAKLNAIVPELLIFLLLVSSSSGLGATATPGVMLKPPPGYYVYNLDPTLNSTDNGPIYDPNFIPGFRVGLTNISLRWNTGLGYAHIGYSIGPWEHLQVALPHLAVGPQCCNFQEIPRTQQYRAVDWGDYYYVKAGFVSPGALGIAATQYVPNAPNKLVYSVVNFWMDTNSSNVLAKEAKSSQDRMIASSHVVVYHPLQLSEAEIGNQTITVNLSPYLEDTLRVLNFTGPSSEPPVVSYVYLNIEGYNMQWSTTLYSFWVMSNHSPSGEKASSSLLPVYYPIPLIIAIVIAVVLYKMKRKAS